MDSTRIAWARQNGYSDDEILASMSRVDPALGQRIGEARRRGIASTEVVDYLSARSGAAPPSAPEDVGFLGGIAREFRQGMAQTRAGELQFQEQYVGALSPEDKKRLSEEQALRDAPPEERSWIEAPFQETATMAGQMVATIPHVAKRAAQGAVLGAGAGAVAGLVGGPAAPLLEGVTIPGGAITGAIRGAMIGFPEAMARSSSGTVAVDLMKAGGSERTSKAAGLAYGATEGLLEAWGAKMLTAPLAKAGSTLVKRYAAEKAQGVVEGAAKQTLKGALKAAALAQVEAQGGEILTENMQEIANAAAEKAVGEIDNVPDLQRAMDSDQLFPRLWDITQKTFLATLIPGGVGAAGTYASSRASAIDLNTGAPVLTKDEQDALAEHRATAQPPPAPPQAPEVAGPAAQSAAVFARELAAEEALRQSPAGAEGLRQDLGEQAAIDPRRVALQSGEGISNLAAQTLLAPGQARTAPGMPVAPEPPPEKDTGVPAWLQNEPAWIEGMADPAPPHTPTAPLESPAYQEAFKAAIGRGAKPVQARQIALEAFADAEAANDRVVLDLAARWERGEQMAPEDQQTVLEYVRAHGGLPESPLDVAAHQAATSPRNALPQPTQAQKEAGVYTKGHAKLYPGVDISIENPVGSIRSGTDPNGQSWEQTLQDHYGYIKKTEGKDGDHVDVFVPEGFIPNPAEDRLFVVDQQAADGTFDEHKVIAGAKTAEAARAIYLRNYDETGPSRIMGISEMGVPEFKEWLKGDTTKPLSTGDANAAQAPESPAASAPTPEVVQPPAAPSGPEVSGAADAATPAVSPEAKRRLLVELDRLHSHPARTKGFLLAPDSQVNNYMKRLRALVAEIRPNDIEKVDAAIAMLEEGWYAEAVQASEGLLSASHTDLFEIKGVLDDVESLASLPSDLKREINSAPAQPAQGSAEVAGGVPAKPLSYKEFLASGRPDSEWESYRDEQNRFSREKGAAHTVSAWNDEGARGNDIANLLRSKGVAIPEEIGKALQHDDTVVSSTSVSGRGMGRAEAKKLHRWVSERMNEFAPAPAQASLESPLHMTPAEYEGHLAELDRKTKRPRPPTVEEAQAFGTKGETVTMDDLPTLSDEALGRIREAIARSLPAEVRLETPATIAPSEEQMKLARAAHGLSDDVNLRVSGLHTVETLDDGTLRDVISLALDAATEATGYHELFHAAERLGLLTDGDLRILDAKYPKGNGDPQEARAKAYASWKTGDKSAPAVVQRIFKKLQAFLERIGNALRGLGYRSAADVFADLDAGRLEARGAEDQMSSFIEYVHYSLDEAANAPTVTDPELLAQLESGPTVKVYRAMQMIGGKLYPPMSASVRGQLRAPTEIGVWEHATEAPGLADAKGFFKLEKGNKKTIKARYNPYFHTSYSPLNDQFSEAYNRPNLVTVEVEIPKSELTSGYKAEKAKDAVGEMAWHSGPVSSKLPASKSRKVILSRYMKVIRVVPDSEVADHVASLLSGEAIVVPGNVVTPSLRSELLARGVDVGPAPKTLSYSLANDPNPTPATRNVIQALQDRANVVIDKIQAFSASGMRNLEHAETFLVKRYIAFGKLGEIKKETKRLWEIFRKASPDDAKAIFAYLTTKEATTDEITDKTRAAEAADAKKMIEQIGDMLARRGVIPQEVIDAHRGEYLPRFYLEFLIGKENYKGLAAGTGKSLSQQGYAKPRKDISIEEQIARGLIEDPAYLISRAYSIPMRDMAILDWLTEISKVSEWVLPGSLIEWSWHEDARYQLGNALYQVNGDGTFDVTVQRKTAKTFTHKGVPGTDLEALLGSEKVAAMVKAGKGKALQKKIGESPKAGQAQYQETGWVQLQHIKYKKDADGKYTVKVRVQEDATKTHQGVAPEALAKVVGETRAAAMLEHGEGHRSATVDPGDWNKGKAKKYPVGQQVRGVPRRVGGQLVTPLWLAQEADRIHKQATEYDDTPEKREMNLRTEARMRALLAEHQDPGFDPKVWKQMPSGKRYGPLAGMIVRKEIHDDLVGNMRVIMGDENWVEGIAQKAEDATALWKWLKVSANLAGQVRNAISNAMIIGMSGTDWHKMPGLMRKAVEQIRTKGEHYRNGMALGFSEATWSNTELRRLDSELLDMMKRQGTGGWLANAHLAFNTVYNATGDWYQNVETFFKLVRYIDNVENKGMTPQRAALDAHEVLIDYSLVPNSMKLLRRAPLGIPFLCVDDSTEILTQRGWQTADTVLVGDQAATMDLSTGRLLWKPVEDVYQAPYSGEMVHVQDRHLDMLMTPDHGVVTYRKRRIPGQRAVNGVHQTLEVVYAKDLTTADHIPVAAPFDRLPLGPPVADPLVEVVGWYVTEGHVHKKCDCVFISQKEGAKADKIRAALAGAGMTWKENTPKKHNTDMVTFYIHATHGRTLRGLCPSKQLTMKFLNRLTTDQIELLVATMLAGDGRTDKNGRRCLVQNPCETLDTFQAALTLIGLSYNVRPHGSKTKAVLIKDADRYCIKRAHRDRRVQYDGRIWCPKVADTGTWVARRNGKVFITHNTYTVKILPVILRSLVNHPAHSLPVVMAAMLLPKVIAASMDIDDDEYDGLMASFSEWVQKKGHVYLWPFKGEDGRWTVVDLGYFFPWATWTDSVQAASRAVKDQDLSEVGNVFRGLGLGGAPLYDLIAVLKTGIDPFTQRPVIDEFGTPKEKFLGAFFYAWNMAMPSMINLGGKGALGKAVDAATGKVDMQGRPKATFGQAARTLVGINTYTYDPFETRERNLLNMEREIQDTESAMKRRLANPNNADDQKKLLEVYLKRIQRINERMAEYAEKAQPR